MRRFRAMFYLAVFTASLPLSLMLFSGWTDARAAAQMHAFTPRLGVVLDTTASMGPELGYLANAWQMHISEPWRAYDSYDLVRYKDNVQYVGATDDGAAFLAWLQQSTAAGGGNCPDADLQGLLALAKALPDGRQPRTQALLLTDSAPQGGRVQLAYTVDKMLARGVSVSALRTGWCPDANMPPLSYEYLATATGGEFFAPDPDTLGTYGITYTAIALGTMAQHDLLESRFGALDGGETLVIPFNVDSSIRVLSVEYVDYDQHCLTCTVPIEAQEMIQFSGSPEMTVEIVNPDGEVITPDTPGYNLLDGGDLRLHTLRADGANPAGGPIFPGGWEVRITGEGDYKIDVLADSSIHLAYFGEHSALRNRPLNVRASLFDAEINQPLTGTFSLVNLAGDQVYPIELFDDGQHGDGEKDDGWFGGAIITPAEPGCWRLSVEGVRADGTRFRRIDPTPIRIGGNGMSAPNDRPALPDSFWEQTFTLFRDAEDIEGGATVFDLGLVSSLGWTPTDTVPISVTLMPGESFEVTVVTTIPADAELGAIEEVTLVAVPVANAVGSLTAASETTVVDMLLTYLPLVLGPD